MRNGRSATSASSALLLDTHVLVWIGTGDRRLSRRVIDMIGDPSIRFYVSAVVAYEFADLAWRGRLDPGAPPLGDLLERIEATVLPYPAEAWRLTTLLPLVHRDPVDRMLVAHAIHADLTLVTADETMRRYPVRTLW